MLNDQDKERLRRLCASAAPGPRLLYPRCIGNSDAIEKGADPIDVAAGSDDWCLGWEVTDHDDVTRTGFHPISRGEFNGPDAALIMATPPEVILALLDEIQQLKALHA
jgi:hypothetical protein